MSDKLAALIAVSKEGAVSVLQGEELEGAGKVDLSAPTGTFNNMLKWDPDYNGFVAPTGAIGPPGWQNRNQSPFGDGAWVIPANSKIEKTILNDILYVWWYKDGTESGGRLYMKMPQNGRAVDVLKVEPFTGTG